MSSKRASAFELGVAIDLMAGRIAAAERQRAYAFMDSLKPGAADAFVECGRWERAIQRRERALQRLIRALVDQARVSIKET